jgi:hypothetical protein
VTRPKSIMGSVACFRVTSDHLLHDSVLIRTFVTFDALKQGDKVSVWLAPPIAGPFCVFKGLRRRRIRVGRRSVRPDSSPSNGIAGLPV